MPLDVRRLGLVGYAEGLALQASLVEARRAGTVGDTLLLLEHPPVITLGARSRHEHTHIVASEAQLAAAGIDVFDTGRGGDVTYHGPGQLVGYPILDLKPDRCDVHRYVRDLEQAIIDAIGTVGVRGARVAGLSGVWVGEPGREEKVAAIGVRISRWITSHGFALNVNTDLSHFGFIVPCGIQGRGVTSLATLTAGQLRMADVEDAVAAAFDAIFTRTADGL